MLELLRLWKIKGNKFYEWPVHTIYLWTVETSGQ